MKLEPFEQIGLFSRRLKAEGITNLSEAASLLHELKVMQKEAGVFVYDRHTLHGSSAKAMVIDDDDFSKECILWTVNHYLGLNRHPEVIRATKSTVETYGTGCGTSAMSVGMNDLHKTLERRLAELLDKEKAILFPTGFTTNTGALGVLPGSKDLVLFDRESHASILEGAKVSKGKFLPFRHNEIADLRQKLEKYIHQFDNIFVVVESAYSMSGEFAPLKEIVELKKTYPFYLYVDEAHTFGIYGPKGQGLCYEMGVLPDVDFFISTLSKATASKGGFVAASKEMCTYLQCHAGAYIFQACLSPADTAAALTALDILSRCPEFAEKLHLNNDYFRSELLKRGFDLGVSRSPIVPLFLPDVKQLHHVSSELLIEGIFTTPVTYPVVGETEGRLRFIVTASHTKEDMDRTVAAIVQAFVKPICT